MIKIVPEMIEREIVAEMTEKGIVAEMIKIAIEMIKIRIVIEKKIVMRSKVAKEHVIDLKKGHQSIKMTNQNQKKKNLSLLIM